MQQDQQQQAGLRPPPGFASTAAAAAPAGLGGFGAFGAANASSFFKQLLPGVNVHVAASPPAAALGGLHLGAAAPATASPAPNPGLALLQQLQRGQQQYQQHH
jgi:hypothetical protein